MCSTFTLRGLMNSRSAGGGYSSAKKNVYKDGFSPRKNGGDEVRDPRIDLA